MYLYIIVSIINYNNIKLQFRKSINTRYIVIVQSVKETKYYIKINKKKKINK